MARVCLRPARGDLTFQNLGAVRGMIAVDQVGNLGGSKDLYVLRGKDGDGDGDDGGFAAFLSQVAVELSSNDEGGYVAQASSVEGGDDDGGATPLPPTPLSSLVKISGASIGNVALTGYDDASVPMSMYHSHRRRCTVVAVTVDGCDVPHPGRVTAVDLPRTNDRPLHPIIRETKDDPPLLTPRWFVLRCCNCHMTPFRLGVVGSFSS